MKRLVLTPDAHEIVYGAHTCKFTRPLEPATEGRVRQALAYKPKDGLFRKVTWHQGKRQVLAVDDVKYLYNRKTREFPTGLIEKVLSLLDKPYEITSLPPRLPYKASVELNGATARPYQVEAFTALTEAGRGVAAIPTGTGKTLVSAMLAKAYYDAKILITVPNINLLDQNKAELEKFISEEIGVLGDGDFNLEPRIVVSTIQSLAAKIERENVDVLKFLTSCRVWISDESHGAAADSYRALSKALPYADNRFGLTATWMREDGCELIMEGILGDVVYEYTYEKAFAEGYLTPIRVWMRDYNHVSMQRAPKTDFNIVYKNRIVNNLGRNFQVALDAAALKDAGLTPCLVLVNQIEQGNHLAALLDAPFVNGEDNKSKTKSKALKATLSEFMSGTYPIVVASKILNVGVNLPNLRSAVNAAAGDSRIDALQKPGRGLRLAPGKDAFDYVDYVDREPNYLRKHSQSRQLTYRTNFPGKLTRIDQAWSLSNIPEGYIKPDLEEI